MPSGSSSTTAPRLTRSLLEKLQSPKTLPSSSLSAPPKRSLSTASGVITHPRFTRRVAARQSLELISQLEVPASPSAQRIEEEEIRQGLGRSQRRPVDRSAAARARQLSREFVQKRNEARRRAKTGRAARRQKVASPRIRASLGEESVLESLAVSPPVKVDYATRLKQFWGFAQHWGLPLQKDKQFDDVACDWADFQFLDGEGCHVGEKLKAALDAWATVSRDRGCISMQRFRRVLRAWKKNAPKQSRLPMPEEFAFLISAGLCFHHSYEMGLYHIGLFCSFLRPSALLNMCLSDVVPPVKKVAGEYHVLIVAPFERQVSTKTGYFDETVVLDGDVLPGLGGLLSAQVAARSHLLQVKPDTPEYFEAKLWGFSASGFLDAWRDVVLKLGLQEFMVSPYQARHGGASRDYILKRRSEEEIRARGHWSTVAAARIYRKPGRIQQMVARLLPAKLRLAKDLQKSFVKSFQDGSFRAASPSLA